MSKQHMTGKPGMETRKLVLLSLMVAMAIISVYLFSIKISYLTYDPKDVFITLAAFWVGPLWSIVASLVVQWIEMITKSETGPIGFIMGFIASVSFFLPASLIYRKHKSFGYAIIGLLAACLTMSITMLVFNYAITPLYLDIDRAELVPSLVTLILPFNLLKTTLNATLILLLYKPLSNALFRSGMLTRPQESHDKTKNTGMGSIIVIMSVLVVLLILMLVWNNATSAT